MAACLVVTAAVAVVIGLVGLAAGCVPQTGRQQDLRTAVRFRGPRTN